MSAEGKRTERGADDWVERVRAASDIVEVIGQSVPLRRSGRNWMGRCPFHEEKTPSFSVHGERQFYHCFSCKAGGDVFTFVMESEKVGFLEAVEMLSRRAGIPVPERRSGEGRGQRARLLEALEAAAAAYEQWLGDPELGARARAYLAGRGLTRDTIRAFRLGLAPAGWDSLATRLRGRVPEQVLVEAGLASRRDGGSGVYDRFRNRLMVPLVAPGGAVLGFGARALAVEDQPKYLNSPETPAYHKGAFLFALEQARRAVAPDGEVIVVEGYFDAIALHQAGLANTVATSGTAFTPDQARLLHRLAPRVALTYDGDRAGREAMMRSLGVLLAEGLDVAVVDLPAGEDPDTLMRRGGSGAWRAVREAAADPVEFVHRHVLRAAGPGDPRERALQAVVDLGAAVGDPVRRRLLAERAAQVLGFPEATLLRAVELKRAGRGAEVPLQAAVARRAESESAPERRMLRLLVQGPGALRWARDDLGPDDFRDPACRAAAVRLWAGEDPCAGADEAAVLARELASGEAEPVAEAAVRAEALGLALRRVRADQRALTLEVRRAGDDPARLAGLEARLAETSARLIDVERRLDEARRELTARPAVGDTHDVMNEIRAIARAAMAGGTEREGGVEP
jgi:DNA primase